MATTIYGTQHCMSEWSFQSSHHYQDAFNEIELSVVIVSQSGQAWRIPAFWAGGDTWRVRFSPPDAGVFTFRSDCSDPNNQSLHHQSGHIIAAQAKDPEDIISQGPLRVSSNRRNLENSKGQPFFWLGDTWWMGLSSRLKWPEEFQTLTYDRHQKGFSVVQIVAGLYPDMPGFDPRGANEAGFPWETGYERINPAYFDMADFRISWLVHSGIVPCIVAAWGYYLKIMGIEK